MAIQQQDTEIDGVINGRTAIAGLLAFAVFLISTLVLFLVRSDAATEVRGNPGTTWLSGETKGRLVMAAAGGSRPSVAVEIGVPGDAYDVVDLGQNVLAHNRVSGEIIVVDGVTGIVAETVEGTMVGADPRSALVPAGDGGVPRRRRQASRRSGSPGTAPSARSTSIDRGFTDWVGTADGRLVARQPHRRLVQHVQRHGRRPPSARQPGRRPRAQRRRRRPGRARSGQLPAALAAQGPDRPDRQRRRGGAAAARSDRDVRPRPRRWPARLLRARRPAERHADDVARRHVGGGTAVRQRPQRGRHLAEPGDRGHRRLAHAGDDGERTPGAVGADRRRAGPPSGRCSSTTLGPDMRSPSTVAASSSSTSSPASRCCSRPTDRPSTADDGERARSRRRGRGRGRRAGREHRHRGERRWAQRSAAGVSRCGRDPIGPGRDHRRCSPTTSTPTATRSSSRRPVRSRPERARSPCWAASRCSTHRRPTSAATPIFDYSIADPDGLTSSSTVTVTVIGEDVNTAPTATDDEARTQSATPVDIDVLRNDTDNEGDPLTITAIETPLNGTVAPISSGVLRYVPAAGFTGTDTFSYTIADGFGGEATAIVRVEVADRGHVEPPSRGGGRSGQHVGGQVGVDRRPGQRHRPGRRPAPGGRRRRPRPAWSWPSSTAARSRRSRPRPRRACSPSPTPSRTPAGCVTPPASRSSSIRCRRTGRPRRSTTRPPRPRSRSPSTSSPTTSIPTVTRCSSSRLTQPAVGGSVVKTSPRTVQFTPTARFIGSAEFQYTVSDPFNQTSTATVIVTVIAPLGSGPVARDDSVSVFAGDTATIAPLANDSHPDGIAFGLAGLPVVREGQATLGAEQHDPVHAPVDRQRPVRAHLHDQGRVRPHGHGVDHGHRGAPATGQPAPVGQGRSRGNHVQHPAHDRRARQRHRSRRAGRHARQHHAAGRRHGPGEHRRSGRPVHTTGELRRARVVQVHDLRHGRCEVHRHGAHPGRATRDRVAHCEPRSRVTVTAPHRRHDDDPPDRQRHRPRRPQQ